MWQDLVFTVGSLVFIFALMPALLSEDKPPVSTSFITGTVLAAYALTFMTLGFVYSTTTTALLAAEWYTLGVQKLGKTRDR